MITEERKEALVNALLETVKNKSVYTTLRNMLTGKNTDIYYSLKGLFSLATHVSIELEKGNKEYLPVLADVFDKIKVLMGEVESGKNK